MDFKTKFDKINAKKNYYPLPRPGCGAPVWFCWFNQGAVPVPLPLWLWPRPLPLAVRKNNEFSIKLFNVKKKCLFYNRYFSSQTVFSFKKMKNVLATDL